VGFSCFEIPHKIKKNPHGVPLPPKPTSISIIAKILYKFHRFRKFIREMYFESRFRKYKGAGSICAKKMKNER
jgi:hypothetical protein